MPHGYAPEGGKRITAHNYRVAKGVNGKIILLPILGECWLRTIPKALPWADLFLSFLSPLCFESEQARAQAVFPPTVYTPLPWGKATGRRASLGNGGGGDVKPTPALPKGGGIMSFCPSVRYKRGYPVLLSGLRPEGALICQPRATPGGRGCSMDTPPKGAKE